MFFIEKESGAQRLNDLSHVTQPVIRRNSLCGFKALSSTPVVLKLEAILQPSPGGQLAISGDTVGHQYWEGGVTGRYQGCC